MGKKLFLKEILSYWNTAEEALCEEARLVTKDTLKDPFCLNRRPGGNGPGRVDSTGKTWITKQGQMRLIPKEDMQNYLDAGWIKGTSQEYRTKLSNVQRGKKHKPLSAEIRKKLSLVRQGKPNINARGFKRSEEQRRRMSKPRGEQAHINMSLASKDKVWISTETDTKRVMRDEVSIWEEKGWKRGRRAFHKSSCIGRIFITNGTENKRILPEFLALWEGKGWKRGRVVQNNSENI